MSQAKHPDPRLREMAFLADAERQGGLASVSHQDLRDHVYKSMVVYLLHEGYLDGIDSVDWPPNRRPTVHDHTGETDLERRARTRRWETMSYLLGDQPITLRLSHKGRVRLAELEQALRTGRDRDPTGIFWSKRHRESALAIAVLTASPSSPVAVACLDMNGLTLINKRGHAVGDQAIRTYLQAIAMFVGEGAEGFRGDGGDEVVIVMRDTTTEAACSSMRMILAQMSKETVQVAGELVVPRLTACCGVASTTNPKADPLELLARADAAQVRAKDASKSEARPSVLLVDGGAPEVL